MATISENLQTIKSSTESIKQAIIDKGGTISGDITTWASAISGIETGGGSAGAAVFFCNCKIFNPSTGILTKSYMFTFDLSSPATWGEIDGVLDLLEIATISVIQLPNGNIAIGVSFEDRNLWDMSVSFVPDVAINASDQIEIGRTYEFTNE